MDWTTFVTGFAGVVGGMLIARYKAKWETRRDADAVRQKRADERDAFQRATLIELQERLHEALVFTSRINLHNVTSCRQIGDWRRRAYLPDDLNEGHRVAMARVHLLTSRVLDPIVRQLVERFKAEVTSVILAQSMEESDLAIARSAVEYAKCNERIGKLLRLPTDPDRLP